MHICCVARESKEQPRYCVTLASQHALYAAPPFLHVFVPTADNYQLQPRATGIFKSIFLHSKVQSYSGRERAGERVSYIQVTLAYYVCTVYVVLATKLVSFCSQKRNYALKLV